MIIKCPNCSTKFNLPDDRFKQGAKAKCTVCKNVFPLGGAQDVDEDPFGFLSDDESENGHGEGMAEASAADQTSPEDAAAFETAPKTAGGAYDLDAAMGEEAKRSGSSKKLALVLALLFLLAAGGGAALYIFAPGLIPFMGGETAPETEEPAETTTSPASNTQVENMSLQDVKQFYINNEKVGPVFVIEGRVINKFEQPKELIKLEATLYDETGAEVLSRELLAGNTVSYFQLQMLTEDELEGELGNRVGILTNNTNIQPGGDVPFMFVFVNPSETVREFGVRVTEAKDPPKQ